MFKFPEPSKKQGKLDDFKMVSLQDLYNLIHKDLNIFPAFGEIKTCSEEERQCKINQIQINIEEMTSKHTEVEEQRNKVSEIQKSHVKDLINNIRENLSQFDRVVKLISREASSKDEPSYQVDPKCEDILQGCNTDLKVITQYISDLKTINDFVIENIQLPVDEVSPLIEMLVKQVKSMD